MKTPIWRVICGGGRRGGAPGAESSMLKILEPNSPRNHVASRAARSRDQKAATPETRFDAGQTCLADQLLRHEAVSLAWPQQRNPSSNVVARNKVLFSQSIHTGRLCDRRAIRSNDPIVRGAENGKPNGTALIISSTVTSPPPHRSRTLPRD